MKYQVGDVVYYYRGWLAKYTNRATIVSREVYNGQVIYVLNDRHWTYEDQVRNKVGEAGPSDTFIMEAQMKALKSIERPSGFKVVMLEVEGSYDVVILSPGGLEVVHRRYLSYEDADVAFFDAEHSLSNEFYS